MKDKITPKKSYRDGHVAVSIQLRCRDYHGDNAKIDASTELTCEHARELAKLLIELADKSDEKTAKKKAAEDRRKKWRDREIAAGRMIVMTGLR